MTLKVQGVWEAEKLVGLLESIDYDSDPLCTEARWLKNLIDRLRRQVQDESDRRHNRIRNEGNKIIQT